LERRRYNSSDFGSWIELGECALPDSKFQGLFYDGELKLLMTRCSRIGNSISSAIRYGFSQFRRAQDLNIVSLSLRGFFDSSGAIFRGMSVVLSLSVDNERLALDLKKYKDKEANNRKRRERRDEIKKGRIKEDLSLGRGDVCFDNDIVLCSENYD